MWGMLPALCCKCAGTQRLRKAAGVGVNMEPCLAGAGPVARLAILFTRLASCLGRVQT